MEDYTKHRRTISKCEGCASDCSETSCFSIERMTQSLVVQKSSDKRPKTEEKQQEIEESITVEETQRPRDWRKISVIIALAYAEFWMAVAYSIQAPFFPFEAEMKGATSTQIGFVFSVYELAAIVSTPIFGKIIPRITPKFFISAGCLVIGLAACTFGSLDYVPSGTPYIAAAFIVRIIEGIGAASLMTATFTITVATFPENAATAFSLLGTAFGVGFIIGPTIGGALYQIGGFVTPFVVAGGFHLLGCIVLSFLLPPTDPVITTGSRNLFRFLFDIEILLYTFSIITCLVMVGFNSATLEPHLRQFNLTPALLGVVFVVIGGIYGLTTPLWGKLCDKGVSPLLINVAGSAMICIGYLLIGPVSFIPLTTTLWLVNVSLALIGLGLAAKIVSSFSGALYRTISKGFPDDITTYSMVSALYTFSSSAGSFIGPTLGGFLLDTTGYITGTEYLFATEATFLCLLLLYTFVSAIKKKKDKEACEREALLRRSVVRRSYLSLSI